MRLISFVILLILSFGLRSFGQVNEVNSDTPPEKKTGYFFSIQSGALLGDKVTFSSSTIHGVKLGRKLRVGGGIGFDSFEDAQTMPVFGSVSWDLFGKKNIVFVQINYGWSPYAWSPALKGNFAFKDIKGGENFSAMIGYRIASGNIQIAMLAGFKHQDVKIEYSYPVYYPQYDMINAIWAGYPNLQKVSEAMNRFAVSLSVGWR